MQYLMLKENEIIRSRNFSIVHLWSHYEPQPFPPLLLSIVQLVLTDMSCKWNEMTNLPNRDDREASTRRFIIVVPESSRAAVENLLLLKKWFRWLHG